MLCRGCLSGSVCWRAVYLNPAGWQHLIAVLAEQPRVNPHAAAGQALVILDRAALLALLLVRPRGSDNPARHPALARLQMVRVGPPDAIAGIPARTSRPRLVAIMEGDAQIKSHGAIFLLNCRPGDSVDHCRRTAGAVRAGCVAGSQHLMRSHGLWMRWQCNNQSGRIAQCDAFAWRRLAGVQTCVLRCNLFRSALCWHSDWRILRVLSSLTPLKAVSHATCPSNGVQRQVAVETAFLLSAARLGAGLCPFMRFMRSL